MAQTLEDLRANLARATARYHLGTATGGSTTTIVDANTLPDNYPDTNQLVGALAYIRTDAGGAGAAPEGASRRIAGYTPATGTITWTNALGSAVAADDIYELYLSDLDRADWDQCINQAILDAWPAFYLTAIQEEIIDDDPDLTYDLPADAQDVLRVEATLRPPLDAWPAQPLPPAAWHLSGTPGDDLALTLHRSPFPGRASLRIVYRAKYPTLDPGDSTELNPDYLHAASLANLYAILADHAGSAQDRTGFLQMLGHWQKQTAALKGAPAK